MLMIESMTKLSPRTPSCFSLQQMGTYQVQTNHINLEVMCVFFESGGHVCWVMIASIPIIHFLGIIEGPGMHEHRLAFIMV